MGFKCQCCGWCCKNVVINVCYSDIMRWEKEERLDILREISYIDNYKKVGNGFYIAKTAFNPKQPCPFLKDGLCSIYATRPLSCKDFPLGVKKSECPAFVFDSEAYKEIVKNQRDDFRRSYENSKELFEILVKARK